MELNLEVKIINRTKWLSKSGDKYIDVVVFDEQSKTKYVLLCEEHNFSKVDKVKNGMPINVRCFLKSSNLRHYERNYLIIQEVNFPFH